MEQETILGISVPTPATLKRYGGTVEKWTELVVAQGGLCGVCGKKPTPNKKTGHVRLVIDHEHVRGWKSMPPEERWKYVRGLVCWFCNHYYLGRGITAEKAEGVLRFLESYELRRDA